MPKAYWIARMTITDAECYATYAAQATSAFAKFGAVVLARGGTAEQVEGDGRPRNVVIEFGSLDQAMCCYRSPEYQAARTHRIDAGAGEIVIVEGV